MDKKKLIAAGQLLYGQRWQTELAAAIGMSDRTVRKWVSEENPIPDNVMGNLIALLQQRRIDIENFLESLND